MQRRFLILAGVLGFLGVLAGAFGAHGLKERLEPSQLETFETGARYHLVHALALFGVAIALGQRASRGLGVAGWSFVVGIVLFPGALYVLAITGLKWLGMIAPIGGVAFMVGWGAIAVDGWGRK